MLDMIHALLRSGDRVLIRPIRGEDRHHDPFQGARGHGGRPAAEPLRGLPGAIVP
jgi:hypothetical protein